MVKKNSGGKNFKKQKKNPNQTRDLIFREDEQVYARITKSLGDTRFKIQCLGTNETKIGHVKGAFRKRVWMNLGDIILVSLRDFDKTKCDIIYKYTSDEANSLKSMGEIPSHINIQATNLEILSGIEQSDVDVDFEFENI